MGAQSAIGVTVKLLEDLLQLRPLLRRHLAVVPASLLGLECFPLRLQDSGEFCKFLCELLEALWALLLGLGGGCGRDARILEIAVSTLQGCETLGSGLLVILGQFVQGL